MEILVPWLVAWGIALPLSFAMTTGLERQQRQYVLRILWLALLVRLVVATIFVLVPSTRVFHEDAVGEEAFALAIASHWRGELALMPHYVAERNVGLVYVFAAFMYLFGIYRLNATVFNSIVGMVSVLLLYRIGRHLFAEIVARRAMLFVAFFPSMIIWSAIAIKDALVGCMVLVSLLYCLRSRENFTFKNVSGMLLPIVVIYPIRFYIVYFMIASLVGTMIIGRGSLVSNLGRQLALVAIVVGMAAFGGLGQYAQEDTRFMDLQAISNYRAGMASSAHSAFGADIDVSTPRGALMFLPIGLAHLLWSPFPWQMTSLRPIMTLPRCCYGGASPPRCCEALRTCFEHSLLHFRR